MSVITLKSTPTDLDKIFSKTKIEAEKEELFQKEGNLRHAGAAKGDATYSQ